MRRTSINPLTLSLALMLLIMAVSALHAAEFPWTLKEWQYRQVFQLVPISSAARINTGLIELAAPKDIPIEHLAPRILDEKGNSVPYQCVDESGQKIETMTAFNDTVRLHFQVVDPNSRHYLVYYGNPGGSVSFGEWDKELASLVLETRENPRNRNVRNWDIMVRTIANSRKSYGKGDRRQINDTENPFGPDDQFISIYRGLLYCPETGEYDFATDSDDASFFLLNGVPVVEWPGGHSESGQFDHFGSVALEAGIHRIEYYHVQSGGGTLARAGWRVPGAREIEIIPESAFVHELRTLPLRVENRDNPSSAFFRSQIQDSFQFGLDGPGFVNVQFTNLSQSAVAPLSVYEWHFGDGAVSLDVEPQHLYVAGGSYDVSLKVTDELGFESEFRKTLNFFNCGGRRIDIQMELDAKDAIAPLNEPLNVVIRCNDSAPESMPFTLTSTLKSKEAELLKQTDRVLLPEKDWLSISREFPRSVGGKDVDEVAFALAYRGTTVASAILRVINSSDSWEGLSFTHGAISDKSGARVVVTLSGNAGSGRLADAAARFRQGSARIVVLDDLLSGQGDVGYPEMLVEKLEKSFVGSRIELQKTRLVDEGGSLSIMRRLPSVLEDIGVPDMIILSASLRNVLHFMPVSAFESELQAIVEKIGAQTNAPIVLVAPPPTLTNPGLSQAYAIAVKRVGLRLGVPVADAHCAFVKAAGEEPLGWREFYRSGPETASVYTVAPGAAGQELIAGLIEQLVLTESKPGRGASK